MFESIAIVGATGAVGRLMRSMLEEREFPFERIKFLASARSAGTDIEFAGRTYQVEGQEFPLGGDIGRTHEGWIIGNGQILCCGDIHQERQFCIQAAQGQED